MVVSRLGRAFGACVLLVLATPAPAQTHGHGHGHGAAPPAAAAETRFRVGDLVIEAPWSRATPQGAPVAGGFMRITNTGATPDRLVGGSAAIAGRFEVHEMATVDGVMRMRPLADGLEIAPGATVELRPGGLHVMFMELRGPLREGVPVRGTLRFERAGSVEVEYRVAPLGATQPGRH
jgi:hypothetical protein